jgi:hypothetical protein
MVWGKRGELRGGRRGAEREHQSWADELGGSGGQRAGNGSILLEGFFRGRVGFPKILGRRS